MCRLDETSTEQVTSDPTQATKKQPLHQRHGGHQRTRQQKAMGAFRTRNTADIDTEKAGKKTHWQENPGDDAEAVHGVVHPLVHAPIFRLKQQVDPLTAQLQLFKVARQAVIQLVPVAAIGTDQPGLSTGRELTVDIPLWRQKTSQAGGAPADLQQRGMIRSLTLQRIGALFLIVDLLGQLADQQLDLVSQVMRQAQNQLSRGFRPSPRQQILDQGFCCVQRPQAQGDRALRIGKNAHRDHVLRFGPWIEVKATQEQQQLLLRQRQQTWASILFEQQVASKSAQTTFCTQPSLRLRMTAIPMQPEAFLIA